MHTQTEQNMPQNSPQTNLPCSPKNTLWQWIPTLYFCSGLPFVAVNILSVIMYKNLGLANDDIVIYTSWLYLPFVIKPLWSPLVDLFKTKRWWIVAAELLIGALFGLVALTLPSNHFFQMSLLVFWLLSFSAATHDISTDGFYMMALEQHQQAAYVGVRSMFYRLAVIVGQGLLVIFAGWLIDVKGNATMAWVIIFVMLGALFVVLALYHQWVLPRPVSDQVRVTNESVLTSFITVFGSFLKKKNIVIAICFLLLYRFGEAQLMKVAPLFMLDPASKEGLALSNQQMGFITGTVGLIALTCGGLAGGYLISRFGLKRMLWPMALAINVPHVAYVFLAMALPQNLAVIGVAVAIEQFGYGFGFTAYILFMIMFADGEHKTAHYAVCTGFMALSMMLPGLLSAPILNALGYANFFVWVCVAAVPTFIVTALIKVDPQFGKKQAQAIINDDAAAAKSSSAEK